MPMTTDAWVAAGPCGRHTHTEGRAETTGPGHVDMMTPDLSQIHLVSWKLKVSKRSLRKQLPRQRARTSYYQSELSESGFPSFLPTTPPLAQCHQQGAGEAQRKEKRDGPLLNERFKFSKIYRNTVDSSKNPNCRNLYMLRSKGSIEHFENKTYCYLQPLFSVSRIISKTKSIA